MDAAALEAMIVSLVTGKLRELVQESVQSRIPEWVARQVQEEMQRVRGEEPRPADRGECEETEPCAGFDALVRETFLPQIHAVAWQIAQEQVACALPDVAERMILAELERL